MKIVADVDTINRLLPSASLRSHSRPSRSQLSIGRKGSSSSVDDREAALLVCTQQDRTGTKYKLKDNVECVFAKFLRDGKCTVRMRQPSVDICISKADPLQLKSFLTLVQAGTTGKNLDGVTLAPLAAASSKQVAKLKTKLVITKRCDYPITSGFPAALETLMVNSCSLCRIDTRVMRLHRLVSLDLSDNHIAALPDDWSGLDSLADLRLSANHLTVLPSGLFSGRLQQTLAHLDLSQNQLTTVSADIYSLTNLVILKFDANKISSLAPGISKLRRLIHLSMSNNELQCVPSDFDRLTLQTVDLFGNPFLADVPPSFEVVDDYNLPSLFELSARRIKNSGIPYTSADVGTRIAAELDSASFCWRCRGACLLAHARCQTRIDLRRVSASATAVDSRGRMFVPGSGVLCSAFCAARFNNKGSIP